MSPLAMSRREVIGRAAATTLGIAAAWKGTVQPLAAQIPVATSPAPDARFPQVPSWKNELKQLAPGVFGTCRRAVLACSHRVFRTRV